MLTKPTVHDNVSDQQVAQSGMWPTPPKRTRFLVRYLYIHIIKFDEVENQDRLDNSTLSPVMSLYVTFTARWWRPCTCARRFTLVTLVDTPFSLCD
jgi:hypothetical protein